MSFKVTVLGSSSAIPTSSRFTSAQIVNISERFFLIDCGEATQIQLRKFKIKFSKINHILISHLHPDHYLGIFGLMSSFALMGRKNPLHIYCFKELKELIDSQFKYYYGSLGYRVEYHFLNQDVSEEIYNDNILTIKTIPLKHRIPTSGFLITEKPKELNIKKDIISYYNLCIKDIIQIKRGFDFIKENGEIIKNSELTEPPISPKSFAYCSDTLYNESIIEIIKNVDLLYHEATFLLSEKDRAIETYHSTAFDAATIAKKANAKKLLIGHFSARYRTSDELLKEACAVFENTIAAEDGLVIEI
ncbi:MAG: ribonuclease Z [Bacteroidetes bacterium GWA2_30_7]|nr:MAG: ribonuclease Z [Bacteroidetes bacterium GWA2_30_7]